MPEQWSAILPQGFPKREVYVCEIIRESATEETESEKSFATEV
jgi:hypothetical protein